MSRSACISLTIVAVTFVGQALPLAIVAAAVPSGRISGLVCRRRRQPLQRLAVDTAALRLLRWLELSFDRERGFCTATTGFFERSAEGFRQSG